MRSAVEGACGEVSVVSAPGEHYLTRHGVVAC